MELVVRRDNLMRALKRVKQNKGGPGIDGMSLGELSGYLKQEWPRIREELLAGCYEPLPVLCIFRSNPDTDSGRSRTPIPIDCGQ